MGEYCFRFFMVRGCLLFWREGDCKIPLLAELSSPCFVFLKCVLFFCVVKFASWFCFVTSIWFVVLFLSSRAKELGIYDSPS